MFELLTSTRFVSSGFLTKLAKVEANELPKVYNSNIKLIEVHEYFLLRLLQISSSSGHTGLSEKLI